MATGDGHIAMLPKLVGMFNWHPANKLSMIHHQDIATAMKLALTGAFDGRIEHCFSSRLAGSAQI